LYQGKAPSLTTEYEAAWTSGPSVTIWRRRIFSNNIYHQIVFLEIIYSIGKRVYLLLALSLSGMS
jgi:hypothetical protein